MIKTIFKFLRAIIITLVVLYGLIVILLHIPIVQEQLTLVACRQLTALLDTPVQIGHITIGYPNRIILDDVRIVDKQGNHLLQSARLGARFDWLPLFRNGRISIHTAQVFGLQADIRRQHPDAPLNIQFIIDKLSSSDEKKSDSSLDLRINSLQVRRSTVKYNVDSEPHTPQLFNPAHIAFSNINANISLKALHTDSINLHVKRLEFQEQSGFKLKGLETHIMGGRKGLTMQGFNLELPDSRLMLDDLELNFLNDSLPFSQVSVQGGLMEGCHVTLADVSPFVPAFADFHDKMSVSLPSFSFSGGQAEINTIKLFSPKSEVYFEMTGMKLLTQEDGKSYAQSNLKEFSVNEAGVKFLMDNFGKDGKTEEGIFNTLQKIHPLCLTGGIRGYLADLEASLFCLTGIGALEAEANIGLDSKGKLLSYKGEVLTEGINLLPLFGEEAKLGNVSMELQFDGRVKDNVPQVYVKGTLPTLEYNGYQYQHITLDGIVKPYTYEGLLALDDPNISLQAYGHADIINNWPSANIEVDIRNFRPHELMLTESRKGMEYSTRIKAQFSGDSPDNLVCDVQMDSLFAIAPQDTFLMEKLTMNAYIAASGGHRVLRIDGDFIHAFIEGEIEFNTLVPELEYLAGYHLASLQSDGQKNKKKRYRTGEDMQCNNNFDIEIKLLGSKFYPYVLDIPLVIKPSLSLQGKIRASEKNIQLSGNVHHLIYDGAEYEGGAFNYSHTDKECKANITVSKHQSGEERMNMMLKANAANDSLQVKVSWGNDALVTNAGMLHAEVSFDRKQSGDLTTLIHVKPSVVTVNNSDWNVAESTVRIDSGYVYFNNFGARNQTQHLEVNGSLTDRLTDSLTIDLNRMAVEYILDVVRFKSVDFAGLATGKIHINGALNKDMQAHTRLHIENFHFNHGLMGNMDVQGLWDKETGILVNADIRETENVRTTVEGFISPQNDSLDLHIGAEETNLAFLNSFVGGVFKNIEGRTRGNVHLYGPFKALNLTGDAVVTASFTPQVLNTPLAMQGDSVKLRQRYIEFSDATLRDKEGHTATVNGRLTHQNLKDMQYHFDIAMNRFLFYNTDDYGTMPFYGQLYGTGDVTLFGGGNRLNVDGDIETAPGTTFYYNLSTPESLTDNKFVTFVDKTIRPEKIVVENLDLFERKDKKQEEEEETDPLNVNIQARVNVNTNTDVKVKMDNMSDYSISTKGNGDIKLDFNSMGETKLTGTYIIESGQYKLSLLENAFLKDFQIEEGSEITFTENGETELDLRAIYTVHSASLTDLIPDATFNHNSVKVNCIIIMTGQLDAPNLAYDIDLPTVNDEEQQLVRSAISTEEQMQRQFVYLLGIGKFYAFDYASTEREQSSDAVSSLLSTTLSGQFNNLLSQALNTNNWSFSSNFSTGQEGWTDLEVEGILSGRMLNNRLLVNGNFGYRENQMQSSNFIGDFDLQYQLLPRSRVLWLKGYKTTNDRYFAKQAFNTWGLGFIMRHEFNNKKDFFPWRKKKSKQTK